MWGEEEIGVGHEIGVGREIGFYILVYIWDYISRFLYIGIHI